MIVAELFALLGIKRDRKSWRRANADIDNFSTKTKKKLGGLANTLGKKVAGLAAGFGALMEGKKALDFEEGLKRLEIASSGAVGSMGEMRDQLFEVSDATGVAKEELLQGTAAFVSLTGDGKAASESMETFAKVAVGTGASMEDITKSAAALNQNLKIDPANFEQAFSILIAGGKAGAIELRDAAGVLSQLTPLIEQFEGGSGVQGLAELGASLQLSRQGFSSARETATGLKALFGSFKINAKKFEDAGIKLFVKDPKTGRKSLRNFSDILDDIASSKLAKDPELLTKAFGSKEAEAAFTQLTKNKGALRELTAETLKANDVAEDYAAFQDSAAGRTKKSLNDIKNLLGQVFSLVVRTLGFFIQHGKITLIVLGGLVAGLIAAKWASIQAAAASAVAWAAAALPFILIGALVAAIILVVYELWQTFTGGESILGDLKEAAVDMFVSMIEWADKMIGKAGEYLDRWTSSIEAVRNRGKIALTGIQEEAARLFIDTHLDELKALSKEEGRDIGHLPAQQIRQMLLARRARLAGSPRQSSAGATTNNALSTTINVTAGEGADGGKIADRVRGVVSEVWNSQMRKAALSTPGGGQ